MIWSREPLHEDLEKVLHNASGLPQHAESFFVKKREGEHSLKQSRANESNSMHNTEDETTGKAIDELICGPYLNPEAPAFAPQFGL